MASNPLFPALWSNPMALSGASSKKQIPSSQPFLQTGSQIAGRPSLGLWVHYGLGSMNENLPSFVVLVTKNPTDQPLYVRLRGSGILDSRYQGVRFSSNKEAVFHLTNPDGICGSGRRAMLDKEVDHGCAGLITDLKQRGMQEDTLVICGGGFGRTSYSQGILTKKTHGRDHHPRCFSMWMAGGGVKPGIVHGATDDFGYNITEYPVHVHDWHASILHLMGIDHTRLTHFHQGRHFRLTDGAGKAVKGILA